MSEIIFSDSSNHKYRTEIPNILFHLGLKANEISLYVAIKRSAGDNGNCTKSSKTLCKEAGVGERNFSKLKRKLAEVQKIINKPLINITTRISECGDPDTDCINVVDIWPENMLFFSQNGGGAKLQVPGAKMQGGVPAKLRGGGAKLRGKEEPYKKNICEEEQKEIKKEKFPLLNFGSHVKISKEDLDKLIDLHSKTVIDEIIECVNDYCAANKPKGYVDYAAAIRTFIRNKKQKYPKTYESSKDNFRKKQMDEYVKQNGGFDANEHILRF